MDISWNHRQCIVCLSSENLTIEHVIPKSLGGKLTSKFLCKPCNDCFGSGFEANARLAPEIRQAASALAGSIPGLIEKLEQGAMYIAQFGEHEIKQRLRSDGQLGTTKLGDGSIIFPESEAPRRIKENLRKSGWDEPTIKVALTKWRDAPVGEVVDLGAGYHIRKWNDHPSSPVYTEDELNPLVALKIVYEFMALLVGGAIYRPEFLFLRDVLREQDRNLAKGMVIYNWASKADAFHGIIFEGNKGEAQFQVRIFGLLAYTISVPRIAIKHPPCSYTHRLDTGQEDAAILHEFDRK